MKCRYEILSTRPISLYFSLYRSLPFDLRPRVRNALGTDGKEQSVSCCSTSIWCCCSVSDERGAGFKQRWEWTERILKVIYIHYKFPGLSSRPIRGVCLTWEKPKRSSRMFFKLFNFSQPKRVAVNNTKYWPWHKIAWQQFNQIHIWSRLSCFLILGTLPIPSLFTRFGE